MSNAWKRSLIEFLFVEYSNIYSPSFFISRVCEISDIGFLYIPFNRGMKFNDVSFVVKSMFLFDVSIVPIQQEFC